MTELYETGVNVFFIPADMAQGEKLSEILLPVFCSQANTEGGTIIIGAAQEADGSIVAEGLPSVSETELLVSLLVSDKSKISVNTIKTVDVIQENGIDILRIEVAPAPWTERPVYINSDPINGVYRYSEGKNVILGEKFITMMAKDSVDLHRDNKILDYSYESSIDFKALERYREIHREKNPLLKWDLLDNEGFMARISAKSEGRLLRAGLLMFGENKNISFCMRKVNYDGERVFEAKNIWSFIELVLPEFDRFEDLKCKQALLEALFNALIHADYSSGNVEVVEEKGSITFINSGIPRSSDSSSLCRNLRIMRMLSLVGYAKNEGLGMELIKDYSNSSKLSVNYEKWRTEITIPIETADKAQAAESANISSRAPIGFYPVVELTKQIKADEIKEPDVIEDIEEIKDTEVDEEPDVIKDIEEIKDTEVDEEPDVIEDIEEIKDTEVEKEPDVIEDIEEIKDT